jgi:hypothetical protein
MVTGLSGLNGKNALSPVEEELSKEKECAMIQNRSMVDKNVLETELTMLFVIFNFVQVGTIYLLFLEQ